ncbi:MAG: 50S ribosomal protein L30 [Epsilonproteobacteria bacterium]|nr:50S ribosomal protein L30 [Campylobacterota bacterium]
MSMIKITLVRGLAGKDKRFKVVAHSLGLHKTGSSVVLKDTPPIRGMINKISFLVSYNSIGDKNDNA